MPSMTAATVDPPLRYHTAKIEEASHVSATKDRLHRLVEQLPIDRVDDAHSLLLPLISAEADRRSGGDREPNGNGPLGAPPVVSGGEFQAQPPRTFAELAAEQSVGPIRDIADLAGDFWSEDESIDDFVAMVRQWRQSGS